MCEYLDRSGHKINVARISGAIREDARTYFSSFTLGRTQSWTDALTLYISVIPHILRLDPLSAYHAKITVGNKQVNSINQSRDATGCGYKPTRSNGLRLLTMSSVTWLCTFKIGPTIMNFNYPSLTGRWSNYRVPVVAYTARLRGVVI